MRLLITRPQPDADASAAKVRGAGHEAVVHPLTAPHFLPLAGAHDPAATIVTSRNGARALAQWPAAAGWRSLPLLAVGEATAATAREAGFADVRSADGDAAAQADFIARSVAPSVGTLLYAAAEERSPTLEQRLAAAGYRLDIVVAYRMTGAAELGAGLVGEIEDGRIDGALFYSRRSAERFLDLLGRAGLEGALAGWSVFVLSPHVAGAFAGRAVGRIEVAGAPREDALIQRLP